MQTRLAPVFDAHTLPGSSFSFDGEKGASVVHNRERGAPAAKLYVASPEEMYREIEKAKQRESSNKWLRERGLHEIAPSSIFADQATAEVLRGSWMADGASLTNSTVEGVSATSPSFAGTGGVTGPDSESGFWRPGRAIRIYWEGVLSSATASAGNLTLNTRLNTISGNSLGPSSANVLAVSMASIVQTMELRAICRSIGAAGALEVGIEWHTLMNATQLTATTDMRNRATPAIDTTANNTIVITGLFTVANAANILITKIFLVEVLN